MELPSIRFSVLSPLLTVIIDHSGIHHTYIHDIIRGVDNYPLPSLRLQSPDLVIMADAPRGRGGFGSRGGKRGGGERGG
jgi:hypothetical protein